MLTQINATFMKGKMSSKYLLLLQSLILRTNKMSDFFFFFIIVKNNPRLFKAEVDFFPSVSAYGLPVLMQKKVVLSMLL